MTVVIGDLLCSTGNSTQYSVLICVGKEYEKEWISESLCCIAELITILQINYVNKILKNEKKKRCSKWDLFQNNLDGGSTDLGEIRLTLKMKKKKPRNNNNNNKKIDSVEHGWWVHGELCLNISIIKSYGMCFAV